MQYHIVNIVIITIKEMNPISASNSLWGVNMPLRNKSKQAMYIYLYFTLKQTLFI